MSYAATVALDLDKGDNKDYQTVYDHLESIGLFRTVQGLGNERNLPETTLYGTFDGQSVESVKELISKEVDKAYSLAKVSGKVFITVGGVEHTWGLRYPKYGS